MEIKKKYLKKNRIALILSICLGLIMSIYTERFELKIILAWINVFLGVFVMYLEFNKRKAINRYFGVLDEKNNRWLGLDGLWHDGYSEMMSSKIQKYYEDGGEDLGYTIGGTFGIVLLFVISAVILIGLVAITEVTNFFQTEHYIILAIFWLYILYKKMIRG